MNILTLKYNLDWRGVKPLAEKLVNIPTQDMLEVNASTSYLNPLQKLNKLPELKEYFDFITNKVQDFVGKDKTIMIERAWFSKYDKDGHIVPHTHPSSTAVACLYIEFPSNAGNLEFKVFDMWQELKISQGDLVIFPAHMMHRSQPNKSGKERWTLTTNFTKKRLI